jgi:hypothetical protein
MFQIFQESGFGGWMVLLFTIAGLAAVTTVGRRWGRPGSIAACWAVAVLAAGAIGIGTAQRSVNRAMGGFRRPAGEAEVARQPPELMVGLLSRGTAEAASNYLLAGQGALLVLLVGGVLVLFRKKEAGTGPERVLAPGIPAGKPTTT